MFWLLGMLIASIVLCVRWPFLGVTLALGGLGLFMGLSLPYAHGVVFATILVYTLLLLAGAGCFLYLHLRRRIQRTPRKPVMA